jgi:hypothetical protein
MDLAFMVPEWQLPSSRDPAVLRAELEWLEAEYRACKDLLDEILADMKRAKPEEHLLI